jgi:alkanesulfonate monooxygenase SsuD/methylene tetrahydromethanopterin reductase-like flavin-dependent oxidoreductase (luciferase family)
VGDEVKAEARLAALRQRRLRGGMQFGYCVPMFAWPGPRLFRTPNVEVVDAQEVIALGREAERIGFDSIWACDHLMLGKGNAVLEGWTVLAALAGATSTPLLGLIHQANLHRHPAIHAHMTATLDQLSGGRFIFFFDTGTMASEHLAYGLDWQAETKDRVAQLEEALEIIQGLWTAPAPIDHQGRFYHLSQAQAAPRPVQAPHPPIWFAGAPPGLVELAARYGNGWNSTPAPLAELRARLARLDEACERAGRSSSDLEKSFETQVLLADDHEALRAKLRSLADKPGAGPDDRLPAGVEEFLNGRCDHLPDAITDTWIIGTPAQARQRVRDLRHLGIDHLMLWFMDAPDRTSMRSFMAEVAPPFQAG